MNESQNETNESIHSPPVHSIDPPSPDPLAESLAEASRIPSPKPGQKIEYLLVVTARSTPADPLLKARIENATRALQALGWEIHRSALTIATPKLPRSPAERRIGVHEAVRREELKQKDTAAALRQKLRDENQRRWEGDDSE